MVNYGNGKIYKLECHTTGQVYIGSTSQSLAKRKGHHIDSYKQWKKGLKGYMTSFEILEGSNFDIYLIENFPCESKDQLHAREGYHIRINECVNKNVAGRSSKQRYEDNKELILGKQKNYYKENSERIKERVRDYQSKNKDKISVKKKIYREKNRDEISEKKKIYYEENKDEIRAYNSEKLTCECGIEFTRNHKSRHEKSQHHISYFEE